MSKKTVQPPAKPNQKQLSLFRNSDGKIIVGQNTTSALIFNDKIEFEASLELGSELISAVLYDEIFVFGLSGCEVKFVHE